MTTTLAQWGVILFGAWLIAVSLFMFVRPGSALQYLGKMASTSLINYTEISLRLIAGLALVIAADLSKFPQIFRVFGLFVVVTSAILYFIPRKWHARYAVWWAGRLTPVFVRLAAPFSLAAGILLIYAVF